MKKQAISILLAVVLLLSVLPLGTLTASAATYSGNCGDNAYWQFDASSGILTITGQGAMDDYSMIDAAPWYYDGSSVTDFGDNVKCVVVETGITRIGGCAFYAHRNLQRVILPNTIESIGIAAFSNCDSLEDVVLPDTLTILETEAFGYCKSLSSITIPKNVTKIDYRVFAYCESLEKIIIMNPQCEIFDEYWTLNDADFTVICGHDNSTAQAYADEFGYEFIAIKENEEPSQPAWAEDYSDIIQILVNNRDIWLEGIGSWEEGGSKKYGLIDFEGDGIPELFVNASLGVSGIGTINRYFKIELDDGTMYELDSREWDSDYDLSGDSIRAFQENESRKVFYLCYDSGRSGIDYGYTTYAFLYYEDREIKSRWLWGIEREYENTTHYYNDGNEKVNLTEEELIEYQEKFLSAYKEIDVTIKTAASYELLGKSNEDVAAILTEMYDAFYEKTDFGDFEEAEIDGDLANQDSEQNNEYQLAVYTKDHTFSVEEGSELYFDVRLYKNGVAEENWQAPALVISDPSVAAAHVGNRHDSFYVIGVKAIYAGETNLTITDTATGAYISIPILVTKKLDGVNSYWLSTVPEFYPNFGIDEDILTNFYNHGGNGLYIKDFSYQENLDKATGKPDGSYHITMTVYNSNYCHGAVDIYTADGEWKDAEMIKKFSDVDSLYDAGEYIYRVAKAGLDILTYTSTAINEETKLEFDVPKNGYFKISVNFAESMGTYIYNMTDYIVLGMSTVISFKDGVSTVNSEFSEAVKKEINENEELKKVVISQMTDISLELLGTTLTKIDSAKTIADVCEQFAEAVEGIFDWELCLETSAGIVEGSIEKLGGVYGFFLNVLTEGMKYSNYIMQTIEICNHLDTTEICIHNHRKTESAVINGVSVESNGNIPEDAILQAYRLYEMDMLEWLSIVDGELSSYSYMAYNICFVHDDATITPDGTVRVKIVAPESNGTPRFLLRQEKDGTWRRLDFVYDDGCIIFDTEHFSAYAILFREEEEAKSKMFLWLAVGIAVIPICGVLGICMHKRKIKKDNKSN